jgi:ribosome-associated heat shock protein Hsp15
MAVEPGTAPVRLDIWLDVACLCRTRSEAQKAIKGGKVHVNGQAAKPHREVKPGDVIELTRLLGLATTEHHLPKAQARTLYQDTTPPPSAEEQAMLDLLRIARPGRPSTPVTPDRRERRRLRRAKEGEEP